MGADVQLRSVLARPSRLHTGGEIGGCPAVVGRLINRRFADSITPCRDEVNLDETQQRVDLTPSEEIVAVCWRAGVRQAVPILDLPLPSPRPAGAKWIDAYRRWVRGG